MDTIDPQTTNETTRFLPPESEFEALAAPDGRIEFHWRMAGEMLTVVMSYGQLRALTAAALEVQLMGEPVPAEG